MISYEILNSNNYIERKVKNIFRIIYNENLYKLIKY